MLYIVQCTVYVRLQFALGLIYFLCYYIILYSMFSTAVSINAGKYMVFISYFLVQYFLLTQQGECLGLNIRAVLYTQIYEI